jgi:glycosyltransferase involved in cell wall biosynthesis
VKVVHLSTVHSPADGRIMDKEARGLSEAGWDVAVVAPHDRNELHGGVRVVAIDRPSHRLTRATLTALRVAMAGLREKGDIYVFHDPELLPVGIVLRLLGKKVIYDVHETHSSSIAHRSDIHRWVRKPLALLVKYLEIATASKLSGIVAATPSICEQFGQLATPRVTVQNFPRLFPTSSKAIPMSSRRAIAIYAGAMSEARGVLTMVDAMAELPESLGAELVLAGRMTPELRSTAQVRRGWDRVSAIGQVSHENVIARLQQARIGLVVLHPEPNYLDSFPTKMFEYMAAGLPVIASHFPLWKSIILDNRCGLLVDPLSPNAIAEAIEYLLEHPVEAEEMGRRGQDLVRDRYNWSPESRKLVTFYTRIAQV